MNKLFCYFVVFLSFFSCSKTNKNSSEVNAISYKLNKIKGTALGTTYSILYFSTKEIEGISHSLDSLFLAVNTSMSTYIPNSDISKINKGGTTIVVDQMFKEVFEISKKVYTETSGYFDPTVGKLVNAWGFGPKNLKLEMSPTTVDSLREYVGFSKIEINNKNILVKQNPNITLDFNAVAKGYCVDRIANYFNQKKIDNYLIELGGELIAKGKHLKKQSSWTVGVDDPNQKEERTLIATLSLEDKAMATSGNYRKFRVDPITGIKYVHTINALTGYTQASNILSVSVLAKNCAIADAYATAFMAMSLKETKKIVASNRHIEVYILYSKTNDSIDSFISSGFKKVLN